MSDYKKVPFTRKGIEIRKRARGGGWDEEIGREISSHLVGKTTYGEKKKSIR